MSISTILGLSKFALLFVMPGVASIIKLGVDIIKYSKMLIDLVANMISAKNLMKFAYANDILRPKMI